jgi:hypothetical protein
MLADRYYAIQQRCENPRSQSWAGYGGRGIRNRFTSAEKFVRYVMRYLPHQTYKGVEIDRENNDGHYEPGNLRLVTKQKNAWNTRRNKFVVYDGEKLPSMEVARRMKSERGMALCVTRAALLLQRGMSWEEVLVRKARGPYKKRKYTTS